ncbi:MAG: hypothetical protein QM235_11610 [Pseudomonadota bacterium]|nr:hypothetical protein [Pseudomonadota bacterium]
MSDNSQTRESNTNNNSYYLLKVIKGKEKRVTEFLKNVYNIDARCAPIGEYLICDESLKMIKEKPEYVREINEIPAEVAGAILKELILTKKNNQAELEINGIVRVTKGKYKGCIGILKKIKDDSNTVSVHLGLLGKMCNVEIPIESVVANRLSEPWVA